ncbi:MAG: flagellar type III secretion system pore protein FliP [Azoarcus sp.]|jgi:flagellar biosynthetic protein FliP|nr:flagellar type III secretion system pore protein FliP [Azoarcus sp.]
MRPSLAAHLRTAAALALALLPLAAGGQESETDLFGLPALTAVPAPGGGTTYSLTVQTLLLLTLLSFLPALVLMMTSFTRIIIVFALLRQAMGTQTSPPNQVLIGMALFLTFFIMSPVAKQVYTEAYRPMAEGAIELDQALERAAIPMRTFMLHQVRESDLSLFTQISRTEPVEKAEQLPMNVVIPAYVTSEVKTAFQIGFIVFIPFIIIDMVVASVLMSMGMMMMSPVIVSLPFKLMLFVIVDGWGLIIGSLVQSFGAT